MTEDYKIVISNPKHDEKTIDVWRRPLEAEGRDDDILVGTIHRVYGTAFGYEFAALPRNDGKPLSWAERRLVDFVIKELHDNYLKSGKFLKSSARTLPA